MRSRLKLWNDSGTKRARIADSPRDPIRSPQHLALTPTGNTRSSLQGLHKVRFSGGILKNRENAESNQKWSRVKAIQLSRLSSLVVRANAGTHNHSRPLVGAGSNSESLNPHGRGVWFPAFAGTTPERERRPKSQFVFATLGGAAVVMNDVASSIACPNGVGMDMRNGTRTRVPAIGTKAISIRRSVARYLITGRSGI
jgi:hypothetical protein